MGRYSLSVHAQLEAALDCRASSEAEQQPCAGLEGRVRSHVAAPTSARPSPRRDETRSPQDFSGSFF